MRIYVAHNYGRRRGLSSEALQDNVNESIKIGLALIKLGHEPFIPNLYHYVHLMANGSIPEDVFFRVVAEWVKVSDSLFVGSEPSSEHSGVQDEINIAERIGIPIYYNIGDIPNGKMPSL